jgi:hypothetical protein
MSGRLPPSIPKVEELPFFDSLRGVSRAEMVRLGLICTTGHINAYRRAFVLGQGGSKKEATWDHAQRQHTCCASKVPWRHKKGCPRLS